ncbi:demethylmenaquinone methyltransferase/2-methoxy-6-polyprenyl-1,4-benzoquinol methylase [Pullulanibacillus pueri]|uniref:Demethylmenaquinone methyltransferase n=1 Tax=Pullulanibacillus pueri TaxID=1437324 RepID=A0A8J3EM41_9BACL|nr:demethylmenaquinone methyltransferase [Pullulanibacillus pueri]MBM7681466.1 demethylmenaquinone methyltransferase/2-methoxy-6-polyprenyl-1,4-benzoquinol methylase [Pullulanibacillus pueri]GGH78988.1 demethylmenaquinone methyltransferase [Pullulanibacillus pueri]
MNEQKSEKVHHVFQSIYKKYDFMNSLISFNQHKVWRKKAMRAMAIAPGKKALDVCCGTGDWTISLAQAVGPKGHVEGLDFSENMLSVARHKIEEQQLSNVTLTHGDAMRLPYADNTFDYVSIGFGLRNVPDYLTVLKEIFRVLKPGGTLTCLETSHPKIPVYTQLYFLYFRYVMPALGKIFNGSYDEYVWLHESTRNFPDKKALTELFSQAGFSPIHVISLTGGVAAIHHATKPPLLK